MPRAIKGRRAPVKGQTRRGSFELSQLVGIALLPGDAGADGGGVAIGVIRGSVYPSDLAANVVEVRLKLRRVLALAVQVGLDGGASSSQFLEGWTLWQLRGAGCNLNNGTRRTASSASAAWRRSRSCLSSASSFEALELISLGSGAAARAGRSAAAGFLE